VTVKLSLGVKYELRVLDMEVVLPWCSVFLRRGDWSYSRKVRKPKG